MERSSSLIKLVVVSSLFFAFVDAAAAVPEGIAATEEAVGWAPKWVSRDKNAHDAKEAYFGKQTYGENDYQQMIGQSDDWWRRKDIFCNQYKTRNEAYRAVEQMKSKYGKGVSTGLVIFNDTGIDVCVRMSRAFGGNEEGRWQKNCWPTSIRAGYYMACLHVKKDGQPHGSQSNIIFVPHDPKLMKNMWQPNQPGMATPGSWTCEWDTPYSMGGWVRGKDGFGLPTPWGKCTLTGMNCEHTWLSKYPQASTSVIAYFRLMK